MSSFIYGREVLPKKVELVYGTHAICTFDALHTNSADKGGIQRDTNNLTLPGGRARLETDLALFLKSSRPRYRTALYLLARRPNKDFNTF